MDVLNDVQFLRQDNANLLREVRSLRSQAALLRERSDELEKKLREQISINSAKNELVVANPGQPKSVDIAKGRQAQPKLRLDMQFGEPSHVTIKTPVKEGSSHVDIEWFDESPSRQMATKSEKEAAFFNSLRPVASGSALIGEAPRAAFEAQHALPEGESPNRATALTAPPSPPEPSDVLSQIRLPSLRSVAPPVTGVALPHVALSLLHLRLIRKETYDSPASVASFMQKLTHAPHPPQSSYRAAFTAAFLTLIPLLGPPGTLPAEWLAFLHDFPSRIPATQRDSIVSIPWPTSAVSIPGVNLEPLRGQSAFTYRQPPPQSQNYHHHRRSRSLSGITRDPIPSSASDPMPLSSIRSPAQQLTSGGAEVATATSLPPCERDAWVLLLALAYAAFPISRVAKKLHKLPITVKLQMVAWLPPGVNVYANLEFASTTVDEAVRELWDSKKEILRLKHGWP